MQLSQQYQGQCCLPRSVINDFSPILRLENSNGNYFVSMDPSCNSPLTSDLYPVMFDYIHVCDTGDVITTVAAGPTIVINGGGRLRG